MKMLAFAVVEIGLAARLERSLPRDPDGAISLVGRVWGVRGVVR
jgi:hypothetical protein